jgi:hypothetical protein
MDDTFKLLLASPILLFIAHRVDWTVALFGALVFLFLAGLALRLDRLERDSEEFKKLYVVPPSEEIAQAIMDLMTKGKTEHANDHRTDQRNPHDR